MSRMLQRKVFQTKAPSCLQPALITMFLLSVFAFSIFCPEHPTLHPPQTLFQIHDCLTSILVQEPEESVPEFPRQCPLWGRTPEAPGDNTSNTHLPQGSMASVSPTPPQGKGRDALLVGHHWHNTGKTKNFVQLM